VRGQLRIKNEELGIKRATITTCFSIEPDRKRMYSLDVSGPSGFISFAGHYIFSDFRIKQVVLEMFRKWFGHCPSEYWSMNGFMAQAWDKRGNEITISQINNQE